MNIKPPNGEILISRTKIDRVIRDRLGPQIAEDFGKSSEELIALCVLKGAMIFAADLVRSIYLDVRMDCIQVASYQGTESTGAVEFITKPRLDLKGKNVLLIEDIIDTGQSMVEVVPYIQSLEPNMLKVAALLDKPTRRKVKFEADYVGFPIGPFYVVGYGLDCEERYRNLQDVWKLKD